MEQYRLILMIIIMILAVADLALTYHYVYNYRKWQPEKPYKLIEMNPLLVFLWNKLGLHLGMFVGSVIILSLDYIIIKEAHWALPVILLGLLVFTLFNHLNNIGLLYKLIIKYPTGHLPIEVFGDVAGNN